MGAEFHLWSAGRTGIKKLIVSFRNFSHALKTAHGGADQHLRKIYVQILQDKIAVCDIINITIITVDRISVTFPKILLHFQSQFVADI